MKPDFRNELNERMEQLSLKEVMPEFSAEEDWQLLSEQLHPAKRRRIIPMWSYAAAVLLLMAGGGLVTFFLKNGPDRQTTASNTLTTVPPIQQPAGNESKSAVADSSPAPAPLTMTPVMDKNNTAVKKRAPKQKEYYSTKSYKTTDIVRNGTPCPIEITINQTMKCPDNKPSAISTCTELEPDQTAKLTYKEHDKVAKNCSLTVKEIEIRSIATGETILLTASSYPSTAQDVFSYITGEKKGDILAGMFSSDCNHQHKKHNIKVDNSYGHVIIQ